MGLTFKRQDDLDKLFDKFASVPDPKKAAFIEVAKFSGISAHPCPI